MAGNGNGQNGNGARKNGRGRRSATSKPGPPRSLNQEQELAIYEKVLTHEKPLSVLAREWKIPRSTLQNIVWRLEDELAQQFTERVEQIKAGQTQALVRNAERCLEAFERSTRDAETIRLEDRYGANGKKLKGPRVIRTVKGQVGDSRFLEVYRASLADVRKIWGAEAPTKYESPEAIGVGDAGAKLRALTDRLSKLLPVIDVEGEAVV